MTETRKLATILALDMVGYSRATEKDDSSAAHAVHRIRDVLTQVASPRNGRIFSSAGDGFMLEFPTATAGLEAALALIETVKQLDPPVQVRIGLHTGEVIVESDGDLLGHAVNIAARLQQRASPGEIVLSEDVRRSARGALTSKLVSLGDVKLDKMSETIDIYAANVERGGLRLPRLGRRGRFAAIAAALLIVGALGAVWLLQPSRGVRTAVFTLRAPAGDAELVSLARGVTSEIVETSHQIGIETVFTDESANSQGRSQEQQARSLDAVFTIEGELVREGETVRASIRLNEVRGQHTLWAQSFERETAHAAELRLEAASAVIAVMECAVSARRDAAQLAASALSTLLRGCELIALGQEGLDEAVRLIEQVTRAAPRSSFLQGRLAGGYWDLYYSAPQTDDRLLQLADAAADAALRIDPGNSEALVVKTDRISYAASRRAWEEALVAALRRSPNSAQLNFYYAWFLRTHGRPEEAVQYQRRALGLRPLSPLYVVTLAFAMASVGHDREAIELLADTEARWPDNSEVWYERFRVNLWFGSRTEAVRLLDHAPSDYNTARLQCYRRVTTALAANTDASRRQATRAAHECWQPSDRFVVLAAAGDVDAAFADVERLLAECPDAISTAAVGQDQGAFPACIIDFPWRTMFYPMTAAMRADPRFMPLMHRGGLLQYWLETDRWPEFCEDPSLPYDCRQEALRVAGAARQP
ncbi:MAG: adenylate/guanylate cyclase domain-containing protein [Hyphomonadaceae bacterium]